jgi:hypothetical protein
LLVAWQAEAQDLDLAGNVLRRLHDVRLGSGEGLHRLGAARPEIETMRPDKGLGHWGTLISQADKSDICPAH